MSAVLLKGRDIAQTAIVPRLKILIKKELELFKTPVRLGLVRVGDNTLGALAYTGSIKKIMDEVGVNICYKLFSRDDSEDIVAKGIRDLVNDQSITGILILTPLPEHLSYVRLSVLLASKDVEGASNFSIYGTTAIHPPTALSILELIKATGKLIEGMDAVVVGRSRIVGQPVAQLLLEQNATVTICHSKTRDLESHVRRADVLVAAVGKAGLIKGDWIKPGAIVIDAGENKVDGKKIGDVEFDTAQEKAAFITPVPGGVGPLTSYMLVQNLVNMAEISRLKRS